MIFTGNFHGEVMMRKIYFISVATAALVLQGCASAGTAFYGPTRPFQAGKMGGVVSCPSSGLGNNILEDRFVKSGCASLADTDNNELAKDMLQSSFSLTNQRCTDFFASKAGKQAGINTVRSSVAPILTLLTGILSIVDFDNDPEGAKRADWEKGLSLASGATLSGLSIYEENFLFSAENIEDVRILTKRAMSHYGLAVLALKNHTFDTSVEYSLEYHMICTPGGIKKLVKKAIQDKQITIVNNTQEAPALTAQQEGDAGSSLEID